MDKRIFKSRLSENDKNLIGRVLNTVKKMQVVEALVVIGSVVKDLYVQGKSGIDLLLLKKVSVSDLDIIRELSQKNMIFEKYDDIYMLKDTLLSIHIQSYDNYIEYLTSILDLSKTEIEVKEWTIGGVCSDVILDDISKGIIFCDKRKKLAKLANKTGTHYYFDNEFKDILIKQLNKKLDLTRNEYEERNYLLFQVGFFECIEIVERIYCHEKRSYNKGFKHVAKESEFLNKYKLTFLNNSQININDMQETLKFISSQYGV